MRVSAYCRVSTDKSDQQNSMKNQVEFFEKYIATQENWILHKIYCDEGISGTQTKKRTEFNQMIDDAKNGLIDLILTKEISRFGRNTVDVLYYTRLLKSCKTDVFFINDGINTAQNDGELRLAIMSSIAQEESRKISERVKFGQLQSMKNGKVFGNGNIYGFELLEGKLTINPHESKKIRDIFCMYAVEKKSITEIADTVSDNEKKWSVMSVSNVLKNEKYVGDLTQGKSTTIDYLTHKRKANRGEKITIKEHHKGIISRKMWELTQKERENRENNGKISQKHHFSGKIKCGKCGRNYVLNRSTTRNYEKWQATCIEKCKKSSNIDCNTIELAVEKVIKLQNIDGVHIKNKIKKIVSKSKVENNDKVVEYLENMDIWTLKTVKNCIIDKIMIDETKIKVILNYSEDSYEVTGGKVAKIT